LPCPPTASPAPGPRSAPLPLKVDGFSLGAVMGYSEQKSVVVLGSDEDVDVFLQVWPGVVAEVKAGAVARRTI
jgi:lipid-binding SYLF domain-containing protein